MWTCPDCGQEFIHSRQWHSCNERTVEYFLSGKSEHTISLFNHFIGEYRKLGVFKLHPARTRIAFAARIRFGYIHRRGRDFLDVVLTFPKSHHDNLCFNRIGEVLKFMQMALEYGSQN